MTSTLPQYVLDMVKFHPVEDLVLAIFREAFPTGIHVQSLVEDDQDWPLVLLRRDADWGIHGGDRRFVDTGTLHVHTYCQGLNADSDAAKLGEASRTVLNAAVGKPYNGLGHLSSVELMSAPRRVPDYATSTGPVQYADLPQGITRYESIYELTIRAPHPL